MNGRDRQLSIGGAPADSNLILVWSGLWYSETVMRSKTPFRA